MAKKRSKTRTHASGTRTKYNVRFILRVQGDNQRGAIWAHVTYKGKRVRFAVGHNRVDPGTWDNDGQRIRGQSLQAITVNTELQHIASRVDDYFQRSRDDNETPSLDELLRELSPSTVKVSTDDDRGTVVGYMKRFAANHTNGGRPLSANTKKSYAVVLNAWRAYESHTHTRHKLSQLKATNKPDELKARKVVEGFERYLKEYGPNGQPCTDNTVRKYIKILSTFLRWAEAETGVQLLRNINVKGSIVAQDTFTLTAEERERIELLDLEQGTRLWHVRNAMVMALYTGLRFSEWKLVQPSEWRKPSQVITMPKTGKPALVVHREPVRSVLKEYEKTGWPSTINSSQKVNMWIKEVARLAGLDRRVTVARSIDGVTHHVQVLLHEALTTHTFRRTKVTLALDDGASLRAVCMETGQDEATARKHYDRPNYDEHVRRLGVTAVTT